MVQNGFNAGLAERKRALRSAARSARDAIPADLRRAWSEQACTAVIEWLRNRERPIRSVMAYVPFRSELDTGPLLEWAWTSGLTVVAPRCIRENRMMELRAIGGWDDLATGAYGIPEPDANRAPLCGDAFVPDAVLVPGLAFDRKGGRLGYGGGYYDRFRPRLAAAAASAGIAPPPWIGLGFEAQLRESVPMDGHDARLDALATENGVGEAVRDEAADEPPGR